ncbi:ras-related protein rab-32 [Anaeramoeba ignava]|uniref:Ras-related protein Rab n=1 Tax=Anaeramoeba ignava TaxID=1746090 RepID=A0A9Q0LIQ3_ANAIG|nr:ras-related protein rab-32 [Anaeramoeba ignava]
MSVYPEELNEYSYKVLVVGDVGGGKTSIIQRFVYNSFSRQYKATIGVDFALKVMNLDENTVVRLQLWDIAGQERFGNMTRIYYKQAVGAFVVFDISRSDSFEGAKKWKADIDSKVVLPNKDPIPIVLLANKVDLLNSEVPSEELEKFCQEMGFVTWFATSAKENTNIEEAMKYLLEKIISFELEKPKTSANTISLQENDSSSKKSGCC